MLTVLAAIAVPQFAELLGDRRLVRGADIVGIRMMELRLDAMEDGRVMMLEANEQDGTVRVRPYFSAADATEAFDQTGLGSQSALLTGAEQASAAVVQVDEEATEEIELPDEIVIKSVNVVSSARSSVIQQEGAQQLESGYSQPILFYPDGTTSTAAVVLMHPKYGQITVKLRGITGGVSIGLVEGVQE